MKRVAEVLAVVFAFASAVFVCPDGAAQPSSGSVCPTCGTRPTDSDVPAQLGGRSVVDCAAEQIPLTPTRGADFHVEELRAFLQTPITVSGEQADGGDAVAIEIELDLSEFRYYTMRRDDEYCFDQVWASGPVRIQLGDDLLRFEANGNLWKAKNELAWHFYASTDLATATGTYRPQVDMSRIHAGRIEMSMRVFSGRMHGDIHVGALYFDDEAQFQRHLAGQPWQYDYEGLSSFSFAFPDAECRDHGRPLTDDDAAELLKGRSARELIAHVANLLTDLRAEDAVWKDGRKTRVEIELGEPLSNSDLGPVALPRRTNRHAARPDVRQRQPRRRRATRGARSTNRDRALDRRTTASIEREGRRARRADRLRLERRTYASRRPRGSMGRDATRFLLRQELHRVPTRQ